MYDSTDAYVRRWFVPFSTLVRRSGGSEEQLRSLIDAHASPGVVYSRSPDGQWWSALGSRTGKFDPKPHADGQHWYAPAALYWLRRGVLDLRGGLSADDAATRNREHFGGQFTLALSAEPLAIETFPDAFRDGLVDAEAAAASAAIEWDGWQYSGYAVCLRTFTGSSCVQKEALGAYLKRQRPKAGDLTACRSILDLMERLDALILPFAPFQRQEGTSGVAIDRLLELMALGSNEPYMLDAAVPGPSPGVSFGS